MDAWQKCCAINGGISADFPYLYGGFPEYLWMWCIKIGFAIFLYCVLYYLSHNGIQNFSLLCFLGRAKILVPD